ncbi:MAG: hypothetical protein EXS00_08155 [Phycisphaerales bacterium]|nr:hypothetical protein [Phycisphaerales bacterium]
MLLFDLAYVSLAILGSPWFIYDAIRRRRRGWAGRLGRGNALGPSAGNRVLIHAVSVGEVNAVRLLVGMLRDGGAEVVVCTTTDTGFARASHLWDGTTGVLVVRYPLDLSVCVNRFLDRMRPDCVALAELELWPNFMRACGQRGVPVCVVNGRLSARSFRRYRWARLLLFPTFAALRVAAVQDEDYAQRFRLMGAHTDRVRVTGNMKWDTAQISDEVPGADDLAREMGVDRSLPLVVAGSTGPGEEALLHQACGSAVQLLCAPRKPERFAEAARALPGCSRRTAGVAQVGKVPASPREARQSGAESDQCAGRFLLDTIGELRRAYSLADVVVIGRSFAPMHGSDMMEPIALGKATVVGPNCSDFASAAEALERGGGLIRTTACELSEVIKRLLGSPDERRALAGAGRKVIRDHQGATGRNCQIIQSLLAGAGKPSRDCKACAHE